jgi:Flp pilus assembly protein TadG
MKHRPAGCIDTDMAQCQTVASLEYTRLRTNTSTSRRTSTRTSARAGTRVGTRTQRGVAALEFALVISVFLVLMTGIIGIGGLLWVKQMLASAATEGARAVLDSSLRGPVDINTGCAAVKDATSWLTVNCSAKPQACAWTMAGGAPAQCVLVVLTYDTSTWPLLSSISTLSSGLGKDWMPDSLSAHAVVQIQEPS